MQQITKLSHVLTVLNSLFSYNVFAFQFPSNEPILIYWLKTPIVGFVFLKPTFENSKFQRVGSSLNKSYSNFNSFFFLAILMVTFFEVN